MQSEGETCTPLSFLLQQVSSRPATPGIITLTYQLHLGYIRADWPAPGIRLREILLFSIQKGASLGRQHGRM
jgi:hypothetical protein